MTDWLSHAAQWRDYSVAWPWLLLAIPLPMLIAAWARPAPLPGSALRVPFGARLERAATAVGSKRPLLAAGALAWAAWVLLCVAAARPQQLGDVVQPPHAGRDLMLALDVSGSMSEPDMELGGQRVDRLTAAKAVIADFLARRDGDRVGLLVFGRSAYVLTPLTLDHQTLREQLQDAVVGLAGQETAVGDAIGLAVKRLSWQTEGQRVLVLLTDGVNTAGVLQPAKAAELARDAGVRVHTIALGGEGVVSLFGFQLPVPGGGNEIDEKSLGDIAASTGGRFFRARDAVELAGIYAEINRIEPVARPGEAMRPRVERYPWPLGAALLLAFLAFVRSRRGGH